MEAFEYRQCSSCHAIGDWHPSRARGFFEQRVLPLFRVRPFRCGSCLRRVFVWGAPKIKIEETGSTLPSPMLVAIEEPDDFQQLIAEVKQAEQRRDQGESG